MLARCTVLLMTAGRLGNQPEVIHKGRRQKKRPRVCEPGVPSKKPHRSVPAECTMLAEQRKVQPQPCTKDDIANDLKADNILAFQMSLLIFPPFRTAKSLHGCF